MKTLNTIALYTIMVFSLLACEKMGDIGAGPTSQAGAGGSTARFTISGNYLYVVDHISLKSFDITDPSNPKYKDRVEVGLNIETIFPYQDKLFIGSSSSMYIYSLANPAQPVRIAKADYTITMACDPIVVKDSIAYAALRAEITGPCGGRGFGNSALMVYDVKDMSRPVLAKTINLMSPQGLGIKDRALYVCERTNGLKVFDLANPYDPTLARTIGNEIFHDVIPYGTILICQIAGGFALYDIGNDPLNPVFISKLMN